MYISLEISDDLLPALVPEGQDPARVALEAWGLEAYRQRRLSGYQLRTLLGLPSRWDLHAMLKEHQISMYTAEELEEELASLQAFRQQHPVRQPA